MRHTSLRIYRPLVAFLLLLPPAGVRAQDTINLRKTVTVEVVRKTKDAVVNISTTKLVTQRVSPFGFDPFWNDMGGQIVRVPASSLGSGFILHPDGYVVTNHHVIDRARQVIVELADGRKLPAELISSDPEADLAVLKISSDKPLPALELGDSADLMIGEPVIAVGNPLGFSHSVSTGIVSAVHRDLKDTREKVMLGDLVQTDAAINPGNSGGPLLNAYGQVIAINTAIRGDAQNIGFAIPVNRLRDLASELMDPARATKTAIAIKFAERRTLTPPATIQTRVVVAGDEKRIVDSINGHQPADLIDAYVQLLKVKPDAHHVVIKTTDGKTQQVAVSAAAVPEAITEAKARLGITVEQMTPMLAERYHMDVDDGLMVSEVLKNSIAARAGLKPGDVITQLGRYRVLTLDDLAKLLPHLPPKGKVPLGIIRGDRSGFVQLEFEAKDK